ncbi:MAG TPA: MOSC N-terminal beta barrel domain-containing protein [Candidatus Binataceae bacterium]|nr:MOSC N-terminal beta barrel domain-containing protein [Candidatus Binataceae bacterium]
MHRRHLGVVSALARYPVKSMRGEALDEALITERGVTGDREWALCETTYGGVMSARAWPAMLDLRAAWAGDPALADDAARGAARVRIEMPGGAIVEAGAPEAAGALSAYLRRTVRFERIRRERLTPAELEAIMRGEAVAPRRDFYDEEVIHLLASGTLDHLRSLAGGAADFDPRRFRANLLVDTGRDIAPGFLEDQWLEGAIEIGGELRIVGMRPALRCAITTHPQAELPHNPAILRTAWNHHRAYVGLFAAVGTPGTIRIGDAVVLTD